MQLLKYVGGNVPVLFANVRYYTKEQGVWVFSNSGNHSSWFASRSWDASENFKRVTLWPALERYFPMGGASVEFDAAQGDMTFARFGIREEKPYLVIVRDAPRNGAGLRFRFDKLLHVSRWHKLRPVDRAVDDHHL
ncbi:hypothetical protein PQ610_06960 [Tardisphaera miroshnichenkoae]